MTVQVQVVMKTTGSRYASDFYKYIVIYRLNQSALSDLRIS